MFPHLQLTNSLHRKKEVFKPLKPHHVDMYVCGITPYDHAHLGHARCYVTFDTLVRLLKFAGYGVTYVRNYTDIDDKIITKAAQNGQSADQVATTFITSYQEDMAKLNCLAPDIEPKVTTHIPEIITFIEGLVATGNAYISNDDVYFDITTHATYGTLSGKKLDDLIPGSRVAVNEQKRNPGDFALWKGNTNNEFWASPWGYGRPGWHIECSAMAHKHLGNTVDIHGGGMDLMFPHHENECAQSESLTKQPLANIWLHNAFININNEKMSKSLGNAVNLKQIFASIDPMVLRFYFLQHHYRTPLDFEPSEFEGVKTAYKKLCALSSESDTQINDQPNKDLIIATITAALFDDLNTPKALGIIFENISTIKQHTPLRKEVVGILQKVFGLTLDQLEHTTQITSEIALLLQEREKARQNKDWGQADALRDKLTKLGYVAQDKKL